MEKRVGVRIKDSDAVSARVRCYDKNGELLSGLAEIDLSIFAAKTVDGSIVQFYNIDIDPPTYREPYSQ